MGEDKSHNTMDKRKINDLQNIKQKTKDRAAQILQKPWVKSDDPEGQTVTAPLVAPAVLLIHEQQLIWTSC